MNRLITLLLMALLSTVLIVVAGGCTHAKWVQKDSIYHDEKRNKSGILRIKNGPLANKRYQNAHKKITNHCGAPLYSIVDKATVPIYSNPVYIPTPAGWMIPVGGGTDLYTFIEFWCHDETVLTREQ